MSHYYTMFGYTLKKWDAMSIQERIDAFETYWKEVSENNADHESWLKT